MWYIPHSGIHRIEELHPAAAPTGRASALEVLSSIQTDLLKNPARGDLVQGPGRIRKERCSNPARGKGKRGGFRYLFLYLADRDHIHLLYLLDKDEQEDLSGEERKALRMLVTEIKRTRESR